MSRATMPMRADTFSRLVAYAILLLLALGVAAAIALLFRGA
jgi:hypothetical protein